MKRDTIKTNKMGKKRRKHYLRLHQIETMRRLRRKYPHEISGGIYPKKNNYDYEITLHEGDKNSVTVDSHCTYCYHTHRDHKQFPNPPSATDLVNAYGDRKLHILFSKEGIYTFRKVKKTKLGETLSTQPFSLHKLRSHWITKHLVDQLYLERIFNGDVRIFNYTKNQMELFLRYYLQCSLIHLGILVQFFPWYIDKIPLH